MENYVDYLVKKKFGAGDAAKLAVVIFALAFISNSVAMWVGRASGLVVLAFGLYPAYLLVSGLRREYEYVVTADHLDVDEIIGGRRRRRLCGFDFDAMELCAPVADKDSAPEMSRDFAKTFNAASAPKAPNARFAVFSGEGGLNLLIFEPDERILAAMRGYARSKVK